MKLDAADEALELFRRKGDSEYGGEAVTQLEHGLQAAAAAMRDGADHALVAAALLHDVGHLLHDLPDDAPDRGVDDLHEQIGAEWIARRFVPATAEPARLHVAAKRYLCATDSEYAAQLSEPSRLSLQLQGGPMNSKEADAFSKLPFAQDAIRLRKWDDEAKIPNAPTPTLEELAACLRAAQLEEPSR